MARYGTTDRFTGGTASIIKIDYGTSANDAFDNNNSTTVGWTTISEPNGWIEYDFGPGVAWAISKIRFNSTGERVKGFTVQGSNNDSDWTSLYTGQHSNTDGWETFEFTTNNRTKYRYIRLANITGWFTNHAFFTELEAFEILPSGGAFLLNMV